MGDVPTRKQAPFFNGDSTPNERNTHNTSYNSCTTENKTVTTIQDDPSIQPIDFRYTANLPFEIGGRSNVYPSIPLTLLAYFRRTQQRIPRLPPKTLLHGPLQPRFQYHSHSFLTYSQCLLRHGPKNPYHPGPSTSRHQQICLRGKKARLQTKSPLL